MCIIFNFNKAILPYFTLINLSCFINYIMWLNTNNLITFQLVPTQLVSLLTVKIVIPINTLVINFLLVHMLLILRYSSLV